MRFLIEPGRWGVASSWRHSLGITSLNRVAGIKTSIYRMDSYMYDQFLHLFGRSHISPLSLYHLLQMSPPILLLLLILLTNVQGIRNYM